MQYAQPKDSYGSIRSMQNIRHGEQILAKDDRCLHQKTLKYFLYRTRKQKQLHMWYLRSGCVDMDAPQPLNYPR
jgi:hypothetical protein